jgi:hypothetical protein
MLAALAGRFDPGPAALCIGLDPTVVSSAAKSLTDGIFEQIEAWEGSNF